MHLQLVSVATPDRLTLPALLYEPRRRSRAVAIWLHGNGGASVFYSVRRSNALGEALCRSGIALCALNNRGAETEKWLKRRRGRRSESVLLGYAHERIRDAVADIDGAITSLRARGYRTFYLIGHSTGANKIAVYDYHRRKNPVRGYVMVAPGDDVGIYFDALGPRRFAQALRRARARVRAGRGVELVPPSLAPLRISWASLYDTIAPDGDYNVFPFLEALRGLSLSRHKPLFREYRALRRPTLVLLAAEDEYCFGEVPRIAGLLRRHASPKVPVRVTTVIGAGHSFHGQEKTLSRAIAAWLARGGRSRGAR